jgi:dethiobiotin synthetase
MKRIIIIGISTEVGKTVAAAAIAEALDSFYWKPIQCGTPTDRQFVEEMRSTKGKTFQEAYLLKEPLSPQMAAELEKRTIYIEGIQIPSCIEPLVIEGTGGILSPVTHEKTWLDMAKQWHGHWILVHRSYLGSLNHFLLTVEALKARGISLAGVIFNGYEEQMLLAHAKTCCLGRIPAKSRITQTLIQELANTWKPALLGL